MHGVFGLQVRRGLLDLRLETVFIGLVGALQLLQFGSVPRSLCIHGGLQLCHLRAQSAGLLKLLTK